MSSIGSVGGQGPSLNQWLQQITNQGQQLGAIGQTAIGQISQAASTAASTAGTSADSILSGMKSGHGHGHHHHGGGAGGLTSQLEDAVTSALQSIGSSSQSGSASSTDPNQVITQAITNFLTAGSSASGSSSTSSSSSNSTDPEAAFEQILNANGVDANQFHQDLMSALQTAQTDTGGKVDFSKVFKNFPPGLMVDEVG